MADYFVSSGGSNTAPYDTWAKAATALQTALTAATAAGDRIALDAAGVPAGDAEVAGNTTWTFGGNVALIVSTNSGTSTITPTTMGETAWVGNSTTNKNITLAGAFRVKIYGLTIRGLAYNCTINSSDGGHFSLESCKLWGSATGATPAFFFGNAANSYTKTKSCEIKSARTTSAAFTATHGGYVEHFGLTVTYAASVSAAWIQPSTAQVVRFYGCDLSSIGSGTTLVGDNITNATEYWFIQCKLPTSAVILATQTITNKASAKAYVLDSDSGDVHVRLGYHDAFGSCVTDTGIYFTAGAAAQSWKIVTTANCSYYTPFVSPFIVLPNSDVATSIQPYCEIARDGSATAYQDDEVWIEVSRKGTANVPLSTFTNDSMALAGTAADQAAGAGTGSWTGLSGTAWSGKIQAPAAFTPSEVGALTARFVVGEPSITVYCDPQIRT